MITTSQSHTSVFKLITVESLASGMFPKSDFLNLKNHYEYAGIKYPGNGANHLAKDGVLEQF